MIILPVEVILFWFLCCVADDEQRNGMDIIPRFFRNIFSLQSKLKNVRLLIILSCSFDPKFLSNVGRKQHHFLN